MELEDIYMDCPANLCPPVFSVEFLGVVNIFLVPILFPKARHHALQVIHSFISLYWELFLNFPFIFCYLFLDGVAVAKQGNQVRS